MTWRLLEKAKKLVDSETWLIERPSRGGLRWALVYPNTYFLGMSSLGFQTVFGLINKNPGITCERAFLPDIDDEDEYRKSGRSLFSLESQTPLQEFDVLGFSVSYELDCLNLLKILEMSKIPPLSNDRDNSHPLIAAGGALATLNPEPLAEFVDFFVIGEAEEVISQINEVILQNRNGGKRKLLNNLSRIPGVYVPSLYKFAFRGSKIISIVPINGAPAIIKRLTISQLNFPTHTLIMSSKTEFADSFLIEVQRGCPWRCSFCVIGHCYFPPRWRMMNDILDTIDKFARGTEKKVGLLGAAVSDHPDIEAICRKLAENNYHISISSMRANSISKKLLDYLVTGGQKTITIAPETSDEDLRSEINKSLKDDEIFQAVKMAARAGIKNIRLYFMIGLPGEKRGAGSRIASFVKRIRKELSVNKSITLSCTINPFIPKPQTPFQGHCMATEKYFKEEIHNLDEDLRGESGIKLNLESPSWSAIQGIISRGDRRISGFLLDSYRKGNLSSLLKSLSSLEFDAEEYIYRKRDEGEIFPWSIIK